MLCWIICLSVVVLLLLLLLLLLPLLLPLAAAAAAAPFWNRVTILADLVQNREGCVLSPLIGDIFERTRPRNC